MIITRLLVPSSINKDLNLIMHWINYFCDGDITKFCNRTGICRLTYNNWILEKTSPHPMSIRKICKKYLLSIDQFMAGPSCLNVETNIPPSISSVVPPTLTVMNKLQQVLKEKTTNFIVIHLKDETDIVTLKVDYIRETMNIETGKFIYYYESDDFKKEDRDTLISKILFSKLSNMVIPYGSYEYFYKETLK